jgi:hypothetical protein
MKNEFEGFFENPTAEKFEKYAPSPEQIAQALMFMCGENPEWYSNSQLRMMAWGGSQKICEFIVKALKMGEKVDLHPGYAGFLMLMQDRLVTSYEEQASDEERRLFPLDKVIDINDQNMEE